MRFHFSDIYYSPFLLLRCLPLFWVAVAMESETLMGQTVKQIIIYDFSQGKESCLKTCLLVHSRLSANVGVDWTSCTSLAPIPQRIVDHSNLRRIVETPEKNTFLSILMTTNPNWSPSMPIEIDYVPWSKKMMDFVIALEKLRDLTIFSASRHENEQKNMRKKPLLPKCRCTRAEIIDYSNRGPQPKTGLGSNFDLNSHNFSTEQVRFNILHTMFICWNFQPINSLSSILKCWSSLFMNYVTHDFLLE